MKRYLIYVLTLFLELMYFTTQQVSYHSTLPCSVYYCYFLNVDGPFCVPSIHWLPTYFSIRIVIVLADWHTTASILARFWWSVRDGDLSSRKFFWGSFHNHIPQPQVPTNHCIPISIGRSVASNISDKSVAFLYAVVIIWLSFWWSSGVWSVWNCWMVSPSCHHARLLRFRGTFSLLKLRLTRKNINDLRWGNFFPGSEKSASICDSEWLMFHGLQVLQELTKSAQK